MFHHAHKADEHGLIYLDMTSCFNFSYLYNLFKFSHLHWRGANLLMLNLYIMNLLTSINDGVRFVLKALNIRTRKYKKDLFGKVLDLSGNYEMIICLQSDSSRSLN